MRTEAGPADMSKPSFITIGITTYNRKEMLVECVRSILDQSFPDFEVLIGNDYVQEPLSLEELGIADPRVRIANHAVNLGEVENMKYLLDHSRSEHFTWLADDDAYHPEFLRVTHDALRRNPALDCVFTDYWWSDVKAAIPPVDPSKVAAMELATEEFLEKYLTKRIRLLGCYGVFKQDFIKRLGGMRRAGTGFGPYSDNLLGIKAAALGQVAYVAEPLVFYRVHGESLSATSGTLEAYTSAQADVAAEFAVLVRDRVAPAAYNRLQFYLYDWFVRDLAAVWGRSRENLRPARLFAFVRLVMGAYVSRLPFDYAMHLIVVTAHQVFSLTKQSIHAWVFRKPH